MLAMIIFAKLFFLREDSRTGTELSAQRTLDSRHATVGRETV